VEVSEYSKGSFFSLRRKKKMGFLLLRLSFSSFLLVLGLVLNLVFVCNGGKSSSFVRKVEKAIDMPLDSDVFHVPSGYNAPQQVFFYLPFLCNLCFFCCFLQFCMIHPRKKGYMFLN
jgi:hypothetical protein